MSLRQVTATRYVAPLREGGSLPGIVESDDLGTYVCKFRGAGQGLRVLVAEVVVGELARRLGVTTPRLVALELDREIARYEADEEVQDLLSSSAGLNLGVDFLPGAFGYDGVLPDGEADVAARVLWLDAYVANVDRSWRNPNVLVWNGALYVIDHGAALYFHHSWTAGPGDPQRFAAQPWDVTGHVMREHVAEAGGLAAVDDGLRALLGEDRLREVVAQVPDAWLGPEPDLERAAYVAHLAARLESRAWLPEVAA